MSKRIKITLKLESDTIIGSGYRIPGGEDIAVRKDSKGYPYLPGETLKGLLRESLEDLLDWEYAGEGMVRATDYFGARQESRNAEESWHGNTCPKQIFVSPLLLDAPPEDVDTCFGERIFTSLENGIIKDGSLRVASCVRKGLTFSGAVTCESDDRADLELVEDALLGIKAIGTSRTRGFGKVHIQIGEWEDVASSNTETEIGAGNHLCYRVRLNEPVRITSRNDSHDTFLASQNHIPGSTVRGAVLNALAKKDPQWFEDNKRFLLKKACFGNLLPDNGHEESAVIPTPKGFYADKLGDDFYHFLTAGDVKSNTKRAKLGAFAVLDMEKGQIDSWSSKTGEHTRINLKLQKDASTESGGMFQASWLEAGQTASGVISLPENTPDETKRRIHAVLSGEIRFGASVHSGLGLCQVLSEAWKEQMPEQCYSYQPGDTIKPVLYLMLLSPLALVNEYGEPCGISKELLSEKLRVSVTELMCATSVTERQGFNRTLGIRLPPTLVYDSGCTFRLTCDAAPTLDAIRQLERNGLGIRQAEGFGRVVFLKDLEKIKEKAPPKQKTVAPMTESKRKEQAKTIWLIENPLPEGLSNSQIGKLEEQCRVAALYPDDAVSTLNQWFDKLIERNDHDEGTYGDIQNFVKWVLTDEAIPVDTVKDRLSLLIDLIRYERKEDNEKWHPLPMQNAIK